MLRTTFRSILAATILLATPASANRFMMLSIDEKDRGFVAIDLDSIRPLAGRQRAWVMTGITQGGPDNKPVYLQSLTEYDCSQERSRTLQISIYDATTRSVIGELPPQGWSFVPPSTAAAAGMEYACGKTVDEESVLDLTASELFNGIAGLSKEDRAAARLAK